MSIEIYSPKAMDIPRPHLDQVTVEPALKEEEKPKKKFFQLAIMIGLPILMICMLVLMVTVGGRSNPMMMVMMGMMMVVMMGSMLGQMLGGNDGDTDLDRQNYFLLLEKRRGQVHAVGRSQHLVQTILYPNPHSLHNMVLARDKTLWTATPESGDVEASADLLAEQSTSFGPYMKARVGTGLIALSPAIKVERTESVAPEQEEPVTSMALRNFLATQNVVPNSPIPVDLTGLPAIGMRGHVPYRYDLVRGMTLSLAYNHSPDILMIGVVADRDDTEWDWIKWLPHNSNTFSDPDDIGYRTLRWSTFNDCCRDLVDHQAVLRQDNARIVVIVDLPDVAPKFPDGISAQSLDRVTFLVMNVRDDKSVTKLEHRFRISNDYGSDRMFSIFNQTHLAKVDVVPRYLAENVARAMAPLRTPRFGRRVLTSGDEKVIVREAPRMLEAVGAPDLEVLDLQRKWRQTDSTTTLEIPVGYKVAQSGGKNATYTPTGELAFLNIVQIASGGTGPHGLGQGGTGTGKSYLLSAIVLILCTLYSPKKLNIITADFKGGATFNKLQKLPHILANLTNLGGSLDAVDRLRDVLLGEAQRRQQIFQDLGGLADIGEYHELQKTRPDLPDMPHLLFVADEFREFITKNPSYKEMFNSIDAVGRSLGMHLMLWSQYISPMMIGETANYSYGISLKVNEAQYSNTVIRRPDAVNLPPVAVGYLFQHDVQDRKWDMFKGFEHSLPYIRRTDAVENQVRQEKRVIDNTLSEFTQTGFAERIDVREDDVVLPGDRELSRTATTSGKDEFTALMDTVYEQAQGYTETYQMWTKPMSTPMTFADVAESELAAPATPNIVIRLGDVDIPYNHKRIPLDVEFTASKGNMIIVGSAGTGRSNVIKAAVASSSLRYEGRHAAWFIYDYAGTSLWPMESFPNVAAYGTGNDQDVWHRIQGEVERVLSLRQNVFSEHRFTSFSDYLNRRDELGITADNYGHMFIAIDGMQQYLETINYDETQMGKMLRWLSQGPQHGIYFVGTANDMNKVPRKTQDFFNLGVRLHINSHMDTFKPPMSSQEFRSIFSKMPQNDPGRVIDDSQTDDKGQIVYHHGRILLPIRETLEPVANTGKYNVRQDFSTQIRDLGHAVSAATIGRASATRLEIVGTQLTPADLWGGIPATLRDLAPKDRPLPYGVDTGTFEPAVLDPSLDGKSSVTGKMRHVVISGESRSGRSTTLRTIMDSASRMFTPEESRFIILDSTGSLIGESMHYAEKGYMRQSSYAMDVEQATDLVENLIDVVASRAPDTTELRSNPRMINERSYFTGPEIFVFVDGSEAFLSPPGQFGGGLLEKLIAALPPYDVGIRIILTLGAAQLPVYTQGNKGIQMLHEKHNMYVLLHSGPYSAGAVVMSTKTRFKKLAPGRAQLFNVSEYNSVEVPIIQVAHTPPLGDV